jgi:hypothetical protein
VLLTFAGSRWARRRPEMLDNVQLISGTVDLLITLALLPVSLFGLAGGLLELAYGVVALGYYWLPRADGAWRCSARDLMPIRARRIIAKSPNSMRKRPTRVEAGDVQS